MNYNVGKKSTPFSIIVFFILLLTFGCKQVPENEAASDKYRLIWNSDPTKSVTLGWDQLQNSDVEVYYGTKDWGRKYWKYKKKVAPTETNKKYEMDTRFALLDNLKAGAKYYFVLKDEFGVSKRYWFKSAPAEPSSFSFIVGGDTKSAGSALEAGRASNRMVGKLRPLFVMFNGDFTSGSGIDAANWHLWLNDWFEQTTTSDGRMIPIFPVHGNHENGDKANLNYIFNSPFHGNDSSSIYYSITIGGNQLHIMALNSEIETGGEQKAWIENDLQHNKNCTFKIAGFHKPFRPHTTRKRENDKLYNNWVWLFDKYGLDIGIDADSHMHKITFPVRPDTTSAKAEMGFIRDDTNGTMYVGEGSWGASPRANDDDKSWTLASASFNQIKWIHVFPDVENTPAHMKIYTVITASKVGDEQTLFDADVEALSEDNLLQIPKNIHLFENENFGNYVQYPYSSKK
ncbi:MAG TPA: metallophosphoesterase [Tangfeifania sp.]|nr:metallophosphoesterase [Tangfeifania sp.]